MSTSHPRSSILIVDDNELTRLSIEYALQDEYDTASAATTDAALQAATDGAFDAVLLDINFHGVDAGVGLLRTLRSMPAYASTPIVAITAHALPGDRDRFLRAGFDAYLGKPFATDELHAVMRRFV